MSQGSNPWVSRPHVQTEALTTATPAVVGLAVTGPTAPQRGVPAPDRVDQLRVLARRAPAPLWWLGVHGGAGESTLAALVPEWSASDHGWPQVPGAAPARVVLTARSNVRGLRAAQAAATQWAAGLVPFVEVIGLVIIADAPGRLPKPLRDLAHVVGGGVPRTWSLPWVEAWRLGEPPAVETAPREVRRLLDDLRAAIELGAVGTAN